MPPPPEPQGQAPPPRARPIRRPLVLAGVNMELGILGRSIEKQPLRMGRYSIRETPLIAPSARAKARLPRHGVSAT